MRKIVLILLLVFTCAVSLAQYPSTQTLGSDSTLVTSKGGLRGRLIPFRYADTASANRERISQYSNAIIAVGNTLYMRDSTATKWIAGGGFNYFSTVSIANDSSIQICNSGVCDTFTSHKVVINNFTVLNDSLIQVCDGTTCDTIHINPTPIQKPYVDSVKAIGFSLYYYINGMAHLGGTFHVDSSTYTTNTKLYNVIDSLSQATNTSIYNVVDSLNGSTYNTIDSLAGTKIDSIFFSSSDNADTLEYLKGGVTYTVGIIDSKQGIITGCQVYYISGLTYGITSGVYKIGTTRYNYPGGTVTLPAADPTYTTRDIIALDSTGAIVIQGTPSANPASPQVSGTQIELIEVQVNPTATTPANTSTQLVYDENVEWMFTSFGLTVDPANTTAPFHGTKDIYTSAGTSGNYFQLNDTTTHSSTDYSNLTFHIKLNGALNNRSNISVQFFNGTVNVSNGIILGTTYGFNKSVTSYQTVVIPITQFNFSSSTFDRVRFIYTGTNFQTFYTDYIQLQSGVPSTGGTGGTFTQIQSNWAQLDSTQVDFIKNKPNISQQISDSLAKPDTIGIYNMGSGIHMIYANGGDTLFAKTLVAGSNVTLTQNSDSSVTINATGGGSGNTNIGAGFQLAVASTNNIKTIFGVSPILLDSTTNVNAITIKFDSTWAHSTAWNNTQYGSLSQQNTNTSNIATNTANIASNTTAIGTKISNITGLVTAGTNVTVTGSGTSGSPYSISSTGGGGGGGTPIDTVATIPLLENTATATPYIYVSDPLRGGMFTYISTGVTADSGTVFPANGKGGGYWVRNTYGNNIYSPTWFGAKRDGITDDAPAFTSMIAAMPSTGGKAVLGGGVYLLASTVVVNKSVTFEGQGYVDSIQGWSTSPKPGITNLRTKTANQIMFDVVENHVAFSYVTLDDEQSGNPTSGALVRADSNYRTHSSIVGISFDHCSFVGGYNNLQLGGAYQFSISNCAFYFAVNNAVYVANRENVDAGDSYISGCTFIPRTGINPPAAIYQLNSGGLRIINNKFNWNTATRFQYCYLADSIQNTSILIVTGNSFENYLTTGIKLTPYTGSSGFANVIINGNEFSNLTTVAKQDIVLSSITNLTILGNTFYKKSYDTAISLTSCSYTQVKNSYYGYGTPVYYSGTNTNIQGDGTGTTYKLPYWSSSTYQGNSHVSDSLGVISMRPNNRNAGWVNDWVADGSGNGKISFVSNSAAGNLDIGIINSNISGGGFSFWQQNSATTSTKLAQFYKSGNSGFGSAVPYNDVGVGTVSVWSTGTAIAPMYDVNHYGKISSDASGNMLLGSSSNKIVIPSGTILGVGTSTPNQTLDVNGDAMMGGVRKSAPIVGLANSGKLFINWDYASTGNGDVDFFANPGAGSNGGFAFYNYSNADVTTHLLQIRSNGRIGLTGIYNPAAMIEIPSSTTDGAAPLKFNTGVVTGSPLAGAMEYTTPQLTFTNDALIRQEIPQIQQFRISTQFDRPTNATLGIVTPLTASVAAGQTYRFEAILYTTSSSASGINFSISGTATATSVIYEAVTMDNATIAAQTRATALATSVGAATAVSNALVKITGTITVNTAGTLAPYFSQNVYGSTASSILVGSTFVVTQIK